MSSYKLTWSIDAEADSPTEAARHIWCNVFRREWPPEPESACVFEVQCPDGSAVRVDLEEARE